MKEDELKKHVEWLQHDDLQTYLQSPHAQAPWFPAYRHKRGDGFSATYFSALVPIQLVSKLVQTNVSWDIRLGDGGPSVWTCYGQDEESKRVYTPFGNQDGIEPLVLYRTFHGLRGKFQEVSQEFRLFHNLCPDRDRFLVFDQDGNESEAIRYGTDFVEIRTDLLLRFCNVKQMALAVYVDSSRHGSLSLEEIGMKETRSRFSKDSYIYHLTVVPADAAFENEFKAFSHLIGKKYVLPGPGPTDDKQEHTENYQRFIIGTDAHGTPITHTCDPELLADYFGKNPEAPNYLTPVFFRADVLSKYYADPQRYLVEDGYLRCAGLWGLSMDNDHADFIVVWLGDLGRDLSERERNYWINFNIPPHGKRISQTNFKRAMMGKFADPIRPDFLFKHAYKHFCELFRKAKGWDFFRPLHSDDEHFLTSLRLPGKDNQAEFDAQLIALTKVLVDSLNEEEISRGLETLEINDKGITKLEKFLIRNGVVDYELHVKFLRILQDLRSKSAAHRKGSNYEQLVKKLNLNDLGQQEVFRALLSASVNFIEFLEKQLLVQPRVGPR